MLHCAKLKELLRKKWNEMYFLDYVVDVSDFVLNSNLMWENGVMRKIMELNTKDRQTIICRKKKKAKLKYTFDPPKTLNLNVDG